MKILQLVQKPQRRGAEVFAYQLSCELRRQRHEVKIAYLYPSEGPSAVPMEESDTVLQGRQASVLEKFPGIHPGLLNRVRALIEEFQPHIIQANGARTVKYGAFAHGKSEKLIYRNIGNPQDWVQGWPRRLFYKRMVMPKIDGIVGVSRITLQRLLHFYHLSTPAVHIPRGIDLHSTNPRQDRAAVRNTNDTPPNAFVLLYIGSLTREKRPDRFLRIVRELRQKLPEVHAWIVGDGDLKRELEIQADSYRMKTAVHFFGIQEDVASVMQASDLLLLTSDTEGIPGVVLEAGYLRIPVVATSVGGVPECVVNLETGILVDPADEDAFARNVLELLQDPARRSRMGESAKSWVIQNFDIQKIAGRYLDFYNDVLKISN